MKSFIFLLVFSNIFLFSTSQTNNGLYSIDTLILDLGVDIALCVDYIHILDAGVGFDSYLWQDGSTEKTYLVTEAGVYWVHAYAGTTKYADTIEIFYWPYPDPNLGPDTTICFGNSFILAPTTGMASYLWMDGSTLPYFIVEQAGLYFVSVTDIHGCMGADSIMVEFSTPVNLNPDSTIICECSSILLDAGEGFTSYLWQDGSTSQYFLVDGEILGVGFHSIEVTTVDTNNCESSDMITVYIIEHEQAVGSHMDIDFPIFTNPGNDIIYFSLENLPKENLIVEIFDFYGRIIYLDEISKSQLQDKSEIDVSNFKCGTYYVRILGRTFEAHKKLLIRKI